MVTAEDGSGILSRSSVVPLPLNWEQDQDCDRGCSDLMVPDYSIDSCDLEDS